MTNEETARRGRQAEELLDHPLLTEALAAMRSNCLSEWEKAPSRDVDGRERLWTMIKLIGLFEGHLKSYVTDGKFATEKLAKLEKSIAERVTGR